jgi:alkanesulfonate monooxygenase SsuD/methylene tetrahydromethanopterin reductase-like flavin-dependent oxidoreductase (luciferase family)
MPANVFALLAGIAARTERIRLGSGVLVLPSYHPLDVAEALATLDQVSRGRAFLGVGVGYREYELAPIRRDFSKRGEIITEALEVLDLVWKTESASYHGKQFDFDDVRVEPRPYGAPPPILVGAMTPVSARRAGRLTDGLIGGLQESITEYLPTLRAYQKAADEAGRPRRLWLKRSVAVAARRRDLEETWLPGYLANRQARLADGASWSPSVLDDADNPKPKDELAAVADGRALVGTPDEIIAEIHRLQEVTGCEAIVVNMDWSSGDVERIESHLRLFAQEVIPALGR